MKINRYMDLELDIQSALKRLIPDNIMNSDGLTDTPERISKMWQECFRGYDQKPEEILSKTFKANHNEMVIVKNIDFYSHCEHHIVPFFGKVHIGYIPNSKVVGISKLARVVECFAHRLQIQERMTTQIADSIMRYVKCAGVIVVIEAQHLCMVMRGVKKINSMTITSAVRGTFKDKIESRSEFLQLIRG